MEAQSEKLNAIYTDMQQAFVSKRAVNYMTDKVALLNRAGAIITDIDSIIKGAAHLTKPIKRKTGGAKSSSDKASSVP